MKTLFKNVKVFDDDFAIVKTTDVLIEDDKISKIQKDITDTCDKTILGNGNILMPGFVNAHAHNPMCLLRNSFDDFCLQEWLFDNILPTEAKMTEEDIYWGEMLSIAEGLKGGITCFEECYFFQDKIIEAIKKAKVRARIGLGKEIGGENIFRSIEKWHNLCKDSPLLTNMLFAHSVYTYSDSELEEMANMAHKLELPLSVHASETLTEVGECDANYGKSPIGLLESVGFFDRPCLIYHGVHCDKDDMAILKQYDVSVATCPSSNLKLASGIAPIYSYLDKGINVCIGTDGPASNNNLDMFKEMFLTSTLAKVSMGKADVVGAKDVLKMATVSGAKALLLDKVGKIKVGWQADLILINTSSLHFQPQSDWASALVYCGNASDVLLSMVAGKVLYDNGKFDIGEDLDTITKKCNEISKRLKG